MLDKLLMIYQQGKVWRLTEDVEMADNQPEGGQSLGQFMGSSQGIGITVFQNSDGTGK